MICPQCKSEMSKKWQPKSAAKVVALSSLVWACGVCGQQFTLSEVKSRAKTEQKAAGVLLVLHGSSTVRADG